MSNSVFQGEHPIELSGDGLMRQAIMTAHDYMQSAVHDIDKIFGKGHAAKHPELIAAYMQTAAVDCGAAIIAQQIRAGLDGLGETLRSDHPLMGETFRGLTDALNDIAGAIKEKEK